MAEEHNALKYGVTISQAASIAAGGGYGDVGVSRISESLAPTIDLWSRREWELLRGEILFSRFVQSPIVAARFSAIEFVNPAGSTKIAVIRQIAAGIAAMGQFDLSIDSGAAIGANPVVTRGVALDRRFPQLGPVSICTLTSSDLAAGAVNVQHRNPASATFPIVTPWIITPGSKLFMVHGSAASQLELNVYWTERSTFPGELQARG